MVLSSVKRSNISITSSGSDQNMDGKLRRKSPLFVNQRENAKLPSKTRNEYEEQGL
jgi:hypothetical protein